MFSAIRRFFSSLFGGADEWVVDEFEEHVLDSIEANDGNRYEKVGPAEKRVDFGSGNVSTNVTDEGRVRVRMR